MGGKVPLTSFAKNDTAGLVTAAMRIRKASCQYAVCRATGCAALTTGSSDF